MPRHVCGYCSPSWDSVYVLETIERQQLRLCSPELVLGLEMCPPVWALGHQSALVPCLPALPSAPGQHLDGLSGVLSVSALSIYCSRVGHSCSSLEPRRKHLEVILPIESSWGWATARISVLFQLLAAFQWPIWDLAIWKTWKCQGIISASKKDGIRCENKFIHHNVKW